MAKSLLAQRVEARLRELGLGSVEAAVRVPGLERNFIRDLLEGKKGSFSAAKAPLVAQALDWSESELRGDALEAKSPLDRRERVVRVPLLSWVSAGRLVNAESQIPEEDAQKLPFAGLGRGEFFALKVEGDSMNRLSPDGSIIVVNRADKTLINGKAYVFWHRAEGTTYKLWHANGGYLAPYSTNEVHEPIIINRKKDFGVVGRVRRSVLDL